MEKTREVAEKEFLAIIEDMDTDNGVSLSYRNEEKEICINALMQMPILSDEDISLIGSGEVSERDRKFEKEEGYAPLNYALDAIYNQTFDATDEEEGN